MPKIMIIEDDPAIREELALLLENEGYTPLAITELTDVPGQAARERPDLILLDIGLPGRDGFSLCAALRKAVPAPVIFVTSRDAGVDEVRALSLGGDDYITKPFNPQELVARVKSNLRRYTMLGNLNTENNALFQVGGLCINDDTKEVTVDGESVKLTPIEYNILLLLVKNCGRVFSINQIYESIWNEEAIGADNTVAVHIRHIREKIEINPKEPRYLKVVWGIGYKVEKDT